MPTLRVTNLLGIQLCMCSLHQAAKGFTPRVNQLGNCFNYLDLISQGFGLNADELVRPYFDEASL